MHTIYVSSVNFCLDEFLLMHCKNYVYNSPAGVTTATSTTSTTTSTSSNNNTPNSSVIAGVGAVGCLLLSIIITAIIAYPIFRLLRKFGFPFCSGSSELCCICSPYCYCAGVHLREDHTGTLKVLPCADCCYTVCGCKRPPPELLSPTHFEWSGPIVYSRGHMANRLGIYSHSDVMRTMQLRQEPIVFVITTQPIGQQQNVFPPTWNYTRL